MKTKEMASVLVMEKLSEDTVKKFSKKEISDFLDLAQSYISQLEHDALKNKAFVNNYTLLLKYEKNN